MEVVATPDEIDTLIGAAAGRTYLVFPEDRKYPIRMKDDIPLKWIKSGPSDHFSGQAQPGEYYALQLGVFASGKEIKRRSPIHGSEIDLR